MSMPFFFKIHWSNGLVTDGHWRNIVGPRDKQDYARHCSQNMIDRYEFGEFKNSQDNEPIGFSFVWDGIECKFNWVVKNKAPDTIPPDHLR